MELHFLGTGSAYPTPKRSSSCIALRHDKGIWLFDCGEGSQIQFQKSALKPGRITKIFITHMHGDHLFGLPGLLCTIGMNSAITDGHVDIYGPVGIKNFVRSSLTLSYSRLPYTFAVHEIMIKSYQDFFPSDSVSSADDISKWELPLHLNEVEGKKISENEHGHYEICVSDNLKVNAGPLNHSIPCLGYVIQEDDLPGKLDIAILKQKGVPAGPLFGKIKGGESIQLQDGSFVNPEDCVGPSRKGRKIAIFGDTCNSDLIKDLVFEADVLVHESTNENDDQEKSVLHGHSSAGMAGAYARSVKARKLVLTHFSQRYRGLNDEEKEGTESVSKLLEQAKETFDSSHVTAADDLSVVTIPIPK